MSRRIKLAVLANEFLAPEIGRTGGFGWAARAVARTFASHPQANVDVVFLTGEIENGPGAGVLEVGGTRLLPRQRTLWNELTMLLRERIDLILTIDYRPTYPRVLRLLPRTPVIVWARDPRTPADMRRIATLRVPGQEHVRPHEASSIDTMGLARLEKRARLFRRRILIASKFPHIVAKLTGAYGLSSPYVLPNPDILDYSAALGPKHPTPRVAFLARLDPYKRPWLFVELARRFPHVEFLMLGRAHYTGPGSWQPSDLPANVKLMGHVDGPEKVKLLASSWVLVNTSIYEESPVSMLEALATETPVLACVDTGDLAGRFGVYAGRFDGTGLEAVPALEQGLRRLLGDRDTRERLGRAGRAWVVDEHNNERFTTSFWSVAAQAGVTGLGDLAISKQSALPRIA